MQGSKGDTDVKNRFLDTVGEGAAAAAKSLQSCLTLCDPGILQARTLEWVAISFSKA